MHGALDSSWRCFAGWRRAEYAMAPLWSDAERFMPHSVPTGKCPVRLSGSLGERAYAEFEIVCKSNLVKGKICSKICQI